MTELLTLVQVEIATDTKSVGIVGGVKVDGQPELAEPVSEFIQERDVPAES